MKKLTNHLDRRCFIRTTATITAGIAGFGLISQEGWGMDRTQEEINIIGPRKGFSPHIGTLVSMMNWMRMALLQSVQQMKVEELDYLHDPKSNTIGAMLLHLAATERFYQVNTLEGKTWDAKERKQWDAPLNLGDEVRKSIRGHSLDYYLDVLRETREKTIAEFRKRDDSWLLAVDKDWPWGPTNNYCKWFHVCEHESNHNGQIKWIRNRLT
ncbi:DinB family protein [Pontibacter sp. 13R65]|uniref:DinB family protein n=1 Tax=Pontibacter sp. 13R65 TaxID=3127458 RepID=UPI00301CED9E